MMYHIMVGYTMFGILLYYNILYTGAEVAGRPGAAGGAVGD